MFVAVYEFEIKEGAETSFREAWLEVSTVAVLVQDSIPQTNRISWLVMLSGLIGKRGKRIVP